MLKTHNLINLGFPLYLILFEILLRTFSSVDASSFIGPGLATSGLGLLIGVLKPKTIKLAPELEEALKKAKKSVVLRPKGDETIVVIGWVATLLELLVWYWCCAITIKNGNATNAENVQTMLIGGSNYILGVILVAFKEREYE